MNLPSNRRATPRPPSAESARPGSECSAGCPRPRGTPRPLHRRTVGPGPQQVAQGPGASFSRRHSGWAVPSVAARRCLLLSRKLQSSVAVLAGRGRGPRGAGFSPTQRAFQVSGLRMDRPPGLPPRPGDQGPSKARGRCALQDPPGQRAAPMMSPSVHLAEPNQFS